MTAGNIATPLNMLLVLAIAAATIVGFIVVPAGIDLPVHWGITGEADRFLPRDLALLLLPAIAFSVLLLLAVAQRIASPVRRESVRHVVGAIVPALLALFLAIQIATVLIGVGHVVDMVRLVVLGLGLLFVVLGNFVPKSQPNRVAGFRFPWTVNDQAVWQSTHRLGGLLMMLGGATIALAAIVTGHPVALAIVTLLGVGLPIAITTVYSYRLSRRN